VGWRRIGAGATIVAGGLAISAPILPWFRVAAADVTSTESLTLTSYGSFMALLGAVLVVCGTARLRRWESWRGWALISAAASVLVLSAGLRGGLDPLGAAKESIRPVSPVVEAAGVATTRGYRERVKSAFDRGEIRVPGALVGGWTAAGAGAIGLVASLPFAVRRADGGPAPVVAPE
jgi:hypothetical protein